MGPKHFPQEVPTSQPGPGVNCCATELGQLHSQGFLKSFGEEGSTNSAWQCPLRTALLLLSLLFPKHQHLLQPGNIVHPSDLPLLTPTEYIAVDAKQWRHPIIPSPFQTLQLGSEDQKWIISQLRAPAPPAPAQWAQPLSVIAAYDLSPLCQATDSKWEQATANWAEEDVPRNIITMKIKSPVTEGYKKSLRQFFVWGWVFFGRVFFLFFLFLFFFRTVSVKLWNLSVQF